MADTPNMLKKIKSLFIVETDEAPEAEQSTPASPVSVSADKKESFIIPESVSGDQQLTSKLLAAIENNNLEGFDYLEFSNTLKSIVHVIEDEAIRYKTAFEMAKTMGSSKEIIIESINHYMKILEKEEGKFREALDNQKQKQITSRENELQSLKDAIKEKESLIQKLNGEIEENLKGIEIKRSELDQAIGKIENTNAQFSASIQAIHNQLKIDMENLKKYI